MVWSLVWVNLDWIWGGPGYIETNHMLSDWGPWCCTLPETNIEPEKRPWKRRFLLETIIFRCHVSFRECTLKGIHPGRLAWNLQTPNLERKMIFQTSMTMFHVNLQGCRYQWSSWKKKITSKVPMQLWLVYAVTYQWGASWLNQEVCRWKNYRAILI